MIDFLICWYSFGWAATAIYAGYFKRLTLCELIGFLLGGGIAFLVHLIGRLSMGDWNCRLVYNESKVGAGK